MSRGRGNLEAIIPQAGGVLARYWRDSGNVLSAWNQTRRAKDSDLYREVGPSRISRKTYEMRVLGRNLGLSVENGCGSIFATLGVTY